MSQRPINLLPHSIVLSCQAGLRTGRYIAAVIAGMVIVVVLATHSRVEHDRAQERLTQARSTADLVLQTEARAADLNHQLREAERMILLHDRIAYPMRVSALLATMVNRLPASVSLDRIDLTTSSRTPQRTSRPQIGSTSSAADAVLPSRFLSGEISGFAASDADIISVLELGSMPPFDDITLDSTRTRTVRGHSAREFRISFRIDLDSAIEQKNASGVIEQVSGIRDQASGARTDH